MNMQSECMMVNIQKSMIGKDFRIAVKDSINHEGLNVIEIPTDRAKNTSSHREMWGHVSREINNFLQDI